MLRHKFCTLAENDPRQQGTDNGIADTNPCAGESVFPTELSGIAHKDYCGEITGAKGKSGKPRTYGTSAEYEAVHTAGLLAGVETHANHHGQEDDGQKNFDKHFVIPLCRYYVISRI